ncbi:unnamed protein product [Alopecurus aequalis]
MRLMSRKRYRQRQRCRRRTRDRGLVALAAKRENLPSQKDDNYQVVRGISRPGLPEITGDELWCLISNSFSLVRLDLWDCNEIISLKIPSLPRFRFLDVAGCDSLQIVESNAPNLSNFYFSGYLCQISLGGSLQVKTLRIICSHQANIVCYARHNLLSIAPNVETLTISSSSEMVNTPILSGKFLHLKDLQISLVGMAAYDYFSLVSFLDASPHLENFVLAIPQHRMEHDLILGGPRQIPEQRYDKLKNVKISGFCSVKSLVELTCHILENTTSLDCLTLDTTRHPTLKCSVTKSGKCFPLVDRGSLVEAQKALLAIRRYVVGKVPSTVKLNILEPCSRCHAVEPLV